jgi:hypothetical protein
MNRRTLVSAILAFFWGPRIVLAGPDRTPPPERWWLVMLPKDDRGQPWLFHSAMSSNGTIVVKASSARQAADRASHMMIHQDHAGLPKTVSVHPWGDRLEPGKPVHIPWVTIQL